MKIAVYTIALNEEKHISRWAESCKDADYRVVVDTGSTDATMEVAREAGCSVHSVKISPWRFDDARNISLAFVPEDSDFCIALDADEVLVDGWRDCLEALPSEVTRPRYRYTWSWNADGSPGVVYMGDKIHRRFGYRWTHPVHEVITPVWGEVQANCGVQIHHFPDGGKPRSYLNLLELAVRERPDDDRNAHYLGREYVFTGQLDKAAAELKRHLALPTALWAAERARSMRYLAQCEPDKAEYWLYRAIAEDSGRRENWFDLALHYYRKNDWAGCYSASVKALSITERCVDYMSEPEAWGALPFDTAAIACWNLGMFDKALQYGMEACKIAPDDARIAANLQHYITAIEKTTP